MHPWHRDQQEDPTRRGLSIGVEELEDAELCNSGSSTPLGPVKSVFQDLPVLKLWSAPERTVWVFACHHFLRPETLRGQECWFLGS